MVMSGIPASAQAQIQNTQANFVLGIKQFILQTRRCNDHSSDLRPLRAFTNPVRCITESMIHSFKQPAAAFLWFYRICVMQASSIYTSLPSQGVAAYSITFAASKGLLFIVCCSVLSSLHNVCWFFKYYIIIFNKLTVICMSTSLSSSEFTIH